MCTCSVKPFPGAPYKGVPGVGGVGVATGTDVAPPPPWEGRAIATHKLRLVEFSAFVEHPRDPDTVWILSYRYPLNTLTARENRTSPNFFNVIL